MSSSRLPRFPAVNKVGIAVVVIIAIIILVISVKSVVTVQAGYRGVVLHLGAVQDRVLGEGLHFVTPFADQVVQMEVRTQKFQADSSAASKDLQEVRTTIALNFRIDPQQVNKIYQLLGVNYQDRVISPTIQESVKASVAKFNAEELITHRETAKDAIAQTIRTTLSSNNLVVQNVFITDFQFSSSFSTQIEQKVVAFQKFLTEQNNLRAIEVVANQTVAQAEGAARANAARANGESKAIQIITQQLRENPEYLQWQAITKWNGQMPYALGSSGFPFFQLPTANTQNLTKS
jgi:regulator of protease activity HflC (stomatin/prohibitin superfamily)